MKDPFATIIFATLFSTPVITLLTSVFAAAVLAYIFLSTAARSTEEEKKKTVSTLFNPSHQEQHVIPFVVLKDPTWRDIGRALERYEEEVAVLMNGLSRSLEVAQETEWDLFVETEPEYLLSKRLQKRIDRMAVLLEENTRLLQTKLLLPFPVLKLLPKNLDNNENGLPEWIFPNVLSKNNPPHRAAKETSLEESSSYDCVAQVMAHITRDWTTLGLFVRQRTYDWCRHEIRSYLKKGDSVLVPGAGLGRLAFDLACDGYSVEANEISLLMASAAHAILQRNVVAETLYPFLMDFFTNEVDSEWRYDAVEFPDVDIANARRGSLSYTVGDFVETYAIPHRLHDGIITCFFIDTASNIYEYLYTIHNVIRVGGVWIHVGPLQWHRNALLHPSADELKGLVKSFGFEILCWSVDSEPIDYRYESTIARSTKYEAFKPLRMVAIRRETTKSFLFPKFLQRRQKPKKHERHEDPAYKIPSHVVIEEL